MYLTVAYLGHDRASLATQSQLTAKEAANLWSEVRKQAELNEMQLVSPAVNFCYGECVEEVTHCSNAVLFVHVASCVFFLLCFT